MKRVCSTLAIFFCAFLIMLLIRRFVGFEIAVLFGIASLQSDVWWFNLKEEGEE